MPIGRGPIIISGFFADGRGISRSAVLTANALERAGIAVIRHDITYVIDPARARASVVIPAGGVWIIHANPPELLVVLDQERELAAAILYRIGYWVWELPQAPAEWLSTSRLLHEIWTPSQFSAGALARAGAHVLVMPHAVTPEVAGTVVRCDAPIRFGIFADLRSGVARKNPLGSLAAYLAAFPLGGTETELVIKLSGSSADPAIITLMRSVQASRTDLKIIDEHLVDDDLRRLLNSIDVVISLHRAEGFGLVLAEAMALGKAVVATAWSGNMEFMVAEDPAQAVPYRLIPVDDASGQYRGGEWAEPDLAAAAILIRRLAHNDGLRKDISRTNPSRIEDLGLLWTASALRRMSFFAFVS
jgi:hypothetical protein